MNERLLRRLPLRASGLLVAVGLTAACAGGTHASAPATPTTSGTSGAAATVSTAAPTTTVAPPTSTTTVSQLLTRSTSSVNWVSQTEDITYDGVKRSYLLFRPSQLQSSSIPVLIELGGCCFGAAKEADRANFRQVASAAILVYPSYTDNHWDAGACCGPPADNHVDDVGFVASVLASVRSQNSDAAKTVAYLAGYSNGAKLATMVACQRPALFSSVAVFGATRTSSCTGPPPASLLIMVGSSDPEVSISGPPVTQNGFAEPTVDQLAGSYRIADGCTGPAAQATIGTLGETVWGNCRGTYEVGIAVYAGHDHSWPQASASTPSAQQVMWNWFANSGR